MKYILLVLSFLMVGCSEMVWTETPSCEMRLDEQKKQYEGSLESVCSQRRFYECKKTQNDEIQSIIESRCGVSYTGNGFNIQ